jgi:hypothetical protein
MKIAFAVVWLLANGNLVGEPWKYFDTFDECSKARWDATPAPSDERVLFFTACVNTTASGKTEAFHWDAR